MGNGVSSTNVKKVAIHNGVVISNSEPMRSSSDGCIVETLNSSKCKADFLELQLDESKELLRLKETEHVETEDKANLLEKQLAEVEGKNFELTDRVSDLEQQLEGFQTNDAQSQGGQNEEVTHLEEQLESKEQFIMKLEDQVKILEADMKKLRSKFKKRLKAVQTETAEARQESALKVYALKDDIKRLEVENTKLIARLDRASSATRSRQGSSGIPSIKSVPDKEEEEKNNLDEWEDGRTKLIVELSNQVSAQEEVVEDLRKQLEVKDLLLKELQTAQRSRPSSGRSPMSSAKPERPASHKKSHWGYPADSLSPPDDLTDQWSPDPDEEEIIVKPNKPSSREGSRKSSAQSQRSGKDIDDSDVIAPLRTKKLLSSRTGSGSNKSSRNSSAVSSDSVLSLSNGDSRSRTSSAQSTGSNSRQRRRLQAAVEDNSSKLSPHRTDSAFSESSGILRTKDSRDSGLEMDNNVSEVGAPSSYKSDFVVDTNDDY